MSDELYSTRQQRLNTVSSPEKYKWWTILLGIKTELEASVARKIDTPELHDYTLDQYGVKIFYDEVSISPDYQIVDQGKYLIAVLKFT